MRLGHPDYIKLLMEAYNKKRANNDLSPLLAQSTPANIRRECLNVYRERYDKKGEQIVRKDEQILRAFFGPAEPGRQFLQAIQEFATDKFRPLDSYLKGDIKKTDDTNLNLLAWLIDFQHRPFIYGMEVILNDKELYTIGQRGKNVEEKGAKPDLPQASEPKDEIGSGIIAGGAKTLERPENPKEERLIKNEQKNKRRRTVVFFLILAACLGGMYFIWQQERNKQMAFGALNTGCMYWTGDHYAEMPCNEERKDRLKLPMDKGKMKSFKRIMQEDTITEKSVGKIYYIKINGGIEYYTEGGNHPVYVTRTLKPLSSYMFKTHLGKQETVTQVP